MIFFFSSKEIEETLADLKNQLRRVERKLDTVIQKENEMSAEMDDLTAKVAANGEVDASAIVLLQGLKQMLDDAIASGDPAALKALSDSLGAQQSDLSAAVAANTPAS